MRSSYENADEWMNLFGILTCVFYSILENLNSHPFQGKIIPFLRAERLKNA